MAEKRTIFVVSSFLCCFLKNYIAFSYHHSHVYLKRGNIIHLTRILTLILNSEWNSEHQAKWKFGCHQMERSILFKFCWILDKYLLYVLGIIRFYQGIGKNEPSVLHDCCSVRQQST